MTTLELPLHVSNPLDFLSGLGLLHISHDQSRRAQWDIPRLGWSASHAVLVLDDRAAPSEGKRNLAALILRDRDTWLAKDHGGAMLQFVYLKLEKPTKSNPSGLKDYSGLTPPLAVLRPWLMLAVEARDERTLSYAAALICESATELAKDADVVPASAFTTRGIPLDPATPLNRDAMQTAFDFTCRNEQFLTQVTRIANSLSTESILDELSGHGSSGSQTRLGLDPMMNVPGAIASPDVVHPRVVAEWLAFRGLSFFPVFGIGRLATTTGCIGRRKDATFTWPSWESPLPVAVVASLLSHPSLEKLSRVTRRAMGISDVYQSALGKGADGYAGRISPSRQLVPSR